MQPEIEPTTDDARLPTLAPHHINRLKLGAILMTLAGIGLFSYFIYSVGLAEIIEGVERFGIVGFAVILGLYLLRLIVRSWAWNLSVNGPFELSSRDTVPGVIIGEAMSTVIPLGILISGTAKAVAVRKRVPLVVGLSSVATENLFYSIVTIVFLILGSLTLVRSFPLEESWIVTIDLLIVGMLVLMVFFVVLIIKQWHLASELCERLYRRGFARSITGAWRMHFRLFENLIYSFYREYPRRFLPIVICEALYHVLGVTEVWYMLSRVTEAFPSLTSAFLLESVSRLITIVFKLIPFGIGVDEAGSQFVSETLALAAGVGVTIAVLRKGRMVFWTAVGLVLILKRGISMRGASHEEEISE